MFQLYRGGDYLNLIYPNVLEEKNTTDTQLFASFLDLHLEMDNETKDDWNTKFYDKRDDFKWLLKRKLIFCLFMYALFLYLTRWMSYKKQNLHTLLSTWVPLQVCVGIRVAHHFSFMCCVVCLFFFFLCLVPNVACVSWLSILYLPLQFSLTFILSMLILPKTWLKKFLTKNIVYIRNLLHNTITYFQVNLTDLYIDYLNDSMQVIYSE